MQLERDKKVVDLVTTMESVYSFVEVVRSYPDKLEVLENIIESILNQTIECVIFIREYAGRGFSSTLQLSLLQLSTDVILNLGKRGYCTAFGQMMAG